MARRRLLYAIAIFVLASVPLIVWRWSANSRGRPAPPTVVETAGKHTEFWRTHLAVHLPESVRAGSQARVRNRFLRKDDGNVPDDLLLAVGDTLRTPPDHHGQTIFDVIAIDEPGVTLAYRAEFHHRSFGRNEITIDRGTVLLPWKPASPATYSSPP